MEHTFYRELWGDQEVTIMELATNAPYPMRVSSDGRVQ